MNTAQSDLPVLVAGAAIGGLAAALALTRCGPQVKVLEQSPQLGEIGAGIQLGPNAFATFDALGIGEKARGRAVCTDQRVLPDALGEMRVGHIPTGAAIRERHLAQGACMAPEVAVTPGEAPRVLDNDFAPAFAHCQRSRIAHTARIVLSARETGCTFHAKGAERLVRNDLRQGRSSERFDDAMEWLYGWQVENCLAR